MGFSSLGVAGVYEGQLSMRDLQSNLLQSITYEGSCYTVLRLEQTGVKKIDRTSDLPVISWNIETHSPFAAKEIERILQIADEVQYPIELLKMYRGAKNVVKELSRSYILAVVTSRMRKTTKSYFKFSGLEKYFSALITYENSKRHKPYPDPLIVAVRRLKIRPNEAVYIGDQKSDIKAARAAKMKLILFGNKLRGADYSTKSFAEIPKLISKLK